MEPSPPGSNMELNHSSSSTPGRKENIRYEENTRSRGTPSRISPTRSLPPPKDPEDQTPDDKIYNINIEKARYSYPELRKYLKDNESSTVT